MPDSYAEAIDLNRMERALARCAALDELPEAGCVRCARKTVMKSVCPCVMCEDTICNALTEAVVEQLA